MIRIPISEAREHLADLGNRVALRGERLVVERRGKNLFALVPVEDLELLERLEDETDLRLAHKALKEKGPNIPWEKVRKDLGFYPDMAYRIEFRPAAVRELRRIPHPFRGRLLTAISALADAPRPPGCVRLQGPEGLHRVRVGDYRIVYLIEDRVLLVCVVRVAHRKDVYRGL